MATMADEDLTPEPDAPEPHAPERDPDTADMFGEPAPTATPAPARPPATDGSAAYTVIARKYRPRTFEDLYGQEAMVRTLRNAFAAGRIAHAFMLTGVRGVGKTTTARLLARALNFQTDSIDAPSLDLSVEGRHCRAIIEGRHMDVLELDAASRTGVGDMRDLLDGVRYAPVEARYKVYIIDEVHMLSTGAFNALLKTLEEPPPHAKFIFATTEIRKVPVTILSRCQRFDLRRVEPDDIIRNLQMILEAEGVRVEAEGLTLIARAAEGSVRDAQSLLDQAIVQAESGQTVPAALIRDMLGLAARRRRQRLPPALRPWCRSGPGRARPVGACPRRLGGTRRWAPGPDPSEGSDRPPGRRRCRRLGTHTRPPLADAAQGPRRGRARTGPRGGDRHGLDPPGPRRRPARA
jgi:DNA polymerase-3 subunit gamma/tau